MIFSVDLVEWYSQNLDTVARGETTPPAPCCALAGTCLCYTRDNSGETLPLDAMVTISTSGIKGD